MDNENIALILKNAINASSSKIQNESKRTKVFVLPPELLKGLLVKNKPPKTSNTSKAETCSSKNNKKTTKNKRQSSRNTKSTTSSVDRARRLSSRQSTASKSSKNTRSQTFLKNSQTGFKNIEPNHEQNTVLENNKESDALKTVGKITIQKKSNPGRITKTKNENKPSDFCIPESSLDVMVDRDQEKCIEIIHKLNDCSINGISDETLDNCSGEKCTTSISDKVEKKGTKNNYDCSINEISSDTIPENNLTNRDTFASNCEKKSCSETVKANVNSEAIDQVLQDPCIEIPQSVASQKILNGEISSRLELNDEKEENFLFTSTLFSDEEETAVIEEETYIVEEIIEYLESGEDEVLEENHKVNIFEENNIQTDDEFLAGNIDNSKQIGVPIKIKYEPSCVTSSVDFKPIVEQKRSGAMKVYVNRRKSRSELSNNEVLERFVPQINNRCNKDGLVNTTFKEISHESSLDESQNLQMTKEKANSEISVNFDKNSLNNAVLTKSGKQCQEIIDLQEVQHPDLETDYIYDKNSLPHIDLIERLIVNACEKLEYSQGVQEKFDSKVDCDSALIETSVVDIGEELGCSQNIPEKSNSEIECKSDENSLTKIVRTETFTANQSQEIKYSQVKEQLNSEIDSNLHESNLVRRANNTPLKDLKETPTSNLKEELKSSQQIQDKYGSEIECNPVQNSLIVSALAGNKKLKYSQNAQKHITNDIEITDNENEIPEPVQELVENLQNHKENTEEIQSNESIKKTKSTHKKLENQRKNVEIKTANTRSQRKSLNAKKDVENSSETVKFTNEQEQREINVESTKNTESGGLAKYSVDSNVSNVIEQTIAISINKSKTSISCNNNELGKSKDYWENENNGSIKSLRQLRNRTKVIPQDPENFCKLKDNIEKEFLNLINCDKSDINLRNNCQVSKRTRSGSLSLQANSSEKLSRSVKKISRKPKSTDSYLENTDRITTLRRRSAIPESETKLSPVVEEINESKESLSNETVEFEKSEMDKKYCNQSTALKDIDDCSSTIMRNSESTVIQKTEEMITPEKNLHESNLNEKLSCNTGSFQNLSFSIERATGESCSSSKREKIIFVRKIKKGRRSKSSQPKDDPAITTDLQKFDNKSNEIDDDSKIMNNTVSSANAIKSNLTQVKISKTDENTNLLEDSINKDEKLNCTSIDSSSCQENISLEKNSLKVRKEKVTPIKRSRRGIIAKSISSKKIEAENAEDNFDINKNSHELESADVLNDEGDNITSNFTTTNNKKTDENMISSKDNADNASECSPVDISNEASSSKLKTEKVSPVEKGRKRRGSKSMVSKNDVIIEKHKEDNCEHGNSSTEFKVSEDILLHDNILTNRIVASAEIQENVENVPDNLDEKSKCNPIESEASAQNRLKIKSRKSSNKKGRRGRYLKYSQVDVNTKANEVDDGGIPSFVENNSDLQEDAIAQIEKVDKTSDAENPINIDMKIDSIIGESDATHDNNLDTIEINDKIKEKPEKCSSKLPRRSCRRDKQESSASKTSVIEIPCTDNIKETKQQSKRSSKINVKHDITDSDDGTKNTEKDLKYMEVRKSGRHRKSNVNYCVPDEDVDVFDSEVWLEKKPSENAPKRRRGRPNRKEALKLGAPVGGNAEKNLQGSMQKDTNSNATANGFNLPPSEISDKSTRKRRATKRSTISEDIFEIESEPIMQEKSLDTADQPQAEALSDTADDTNHFEDNHYSNRYVEEDLVEERRPRRGKKRKCSFIAQPSKRRGLVSMKRKVKSNDGDYIPHHSYVTRPTKVKEKSKENIDKKVVKCGKCQKELPKNQWYNHNLNSHNDMGWLDGTEKPDFENDQKLLMRVLTCAHKKKHKKGLTCEACCEVKRSVVGFISHITFCGKTEEEITALLITCDQCGGLFKPSSMEYHERAHRLEAEGKKKREQEAAEKMIDIFEPRSKRKAAEKAVSKISEFTALVKDEDEFSGKKLKLSSPHIKKFIQKPLATKKISSLVIVKWKKELKNNQEAACSQLGCEFTCKSLDEMREHYSSCNFAVTENYVCKVCHYETLYEDEIIKHAAEKHTFEDLDINATMSGAEVSDSEDYSDFELEDSNQSQILVKKFFYKETSSVANKLFKFIFNNGVCHTVINKTFLSGFEWTLEFERKHFKFSIFNDLIPNAFTLLEPKDADTYLPELDLSMPTRFIKKDGHLNESEWKNWARFEAARVDDSPTFFVGGPVWAMAWAPTPSFVAISDNLPQFLAVSTHPVMDVEYSAGQSYSGRNIIQIWSLGSLNNRNASGSDPELSYAITHNGGTVWSLEWCPSGCYQHENFPNLKNENDSNRLGLLAAGCSDGCIRIYSLIFPQDLLHTPNENQYPIYKTEPVVKLIVNSEIYDSKSDSWQVMKLSWSRESDHNVIVAGFSNGYVAFWDLTTRSPMLRYKVNNTTFYRPYKQFFAHHHAVTMVALVPQDNKRYLATASLDKLYKFWDLEDTTKPKNTYKKSYVTDGSWLNNWCCAFLAHDDALCMGHNPSVCLPLRHYTYKYYNMLPSNSTTYAIATSDFGNSVATGNVAGELLTLFPHQVMYIRDMERTIPSKRNYSLVSTAELVDFEVEQASSLPLNKHKKVNNEPYSVPAEFLPSTYKDSKDRFGIQFNNNTNLSQNNSKKSQKYKRKATLTCEQLDKAPIEQYPLKSINKVAWNPNASSFLWLAAGYQNGFVRLISCRSVASTTEWNRLLQLHANALKAQMTKTAAEGDR